MSKVLNVLALLLVAGLVSVGAQTASTVLNGLVYTFPAADGASGQVLVNDGAGGLSWVTASPGGSAVMPTGMLVFSTETCATLGYSDYNTANGFYPVGATAGLGGTVGTALSSGENRATGSHTHSASGTVNISNGSHTHTVTDAGHSHVWNPVASGSYGREPELVGEPPNMEEAPGYGVQSGASRTSDSSGVGVTTGGTSISASGSITDFTINNGGTGTGTNAPYRQLRMCQK